MFLPHHTSWGFTDRKSTGLQPTFQYNYSADNVIVGTTGMDDVAMLMGERTLVEKNHVTKTF